MKSDKRKFRTLKIQLIVFSLIAVLSIPIISVLAQYENEQENNSRDDSRSSDSKHQRSDERLRSLPQDIKSAMSRLSKDAEVNSLGPDRLPTMISSDSFGTISRDSLRPLSNSKEPDEFRVDEALRTSVLSEIAAVFRLTPDELELQSARLIKSSENDGDNGKNDATIAVYRQVKNGIAVVGGELAVIIDREGRVKVVSSTARGGQDVDAVPNTGKDIARETAISYIGEIIPQAQIDKVDEGRLVYLLASRDFSLHLAYVHQVTGISNNEPFSDLVYTDADSNQVVDVHATIHSAINRQIYTANNTFNLPGTARRFEGQGANTDPIVNANYDYFGVTYGWYLNLFGRDSFNNGGAIIRSSVHVGVNYVNAYWNTQQFAFGDGDGQQSSNLANSLDVTAHEYTHAVTQYTSGLVYQNEPGALNEAWSDIFGAVVEARQTLGANGYNANTWKIGEDVWTPFIGGDALRYMDDPIRDGASRDYYPLRYIGGADNGGVHWNSGIANLAFKLTVTGGMHPRGRNNIQVPGIGIDKARRIYYRAGAVYLRQNSNFEAARAATAQAARDLFGLCTAEYVAVQRAWDAVAVPGTWRCSGGGGGDIHFFTYANEPYDWQGSGCYDVAQSSNPATSSIRFQMDAVPFANPGTTVARRVGFTFPDTSRPYIVILNRATPYIQIKTPSGGADTRISIVGDVNQSATIRFYENAGAGRLLGTIVVYRHSNGIYEYSAQYANGGVIRAYMHPGVVVDANFQPGWNVAVRGLAGVYPAEPNLLSRWGQAYSANTLRTNPTALNQFAASWSCPSGQSLFDAPGLAAEPEVFPTVVTRLTSPEAEQMCEDAGVPRSEEDRFANCVFDVVEGGDEFGQIMAAHAGTVWQLENQPPPAAEPDPCAPTEPTPSPEPPTTPVPEPTEPPTTPAPEPSEQTLHNTRSNQKTVICHAEPETTNDLPNQTLIRLFGDYRNKAVRKDFFQK